MLLLEEITKLAITLIVFLLIVSAVYVSRRKAGSRHNNLILTCLLLSMALSLFDRMIFLYRHILPPESTYLNFIFDTFQLNILPLIYLYAFSFTKKQLRFRWFDILHFTPFLFSFFDTLLNYTFATQPERVDILLNGNLPGFYHSHHFSLQIMSIIRILQVFYPVVAAVELYKYRKSLSSHFSDKKSIDKKGQQWLFYMCLLYVLVYIIGVSFKSLFPEILSSFPPVIITNIIYAAIFLYFGIRNPILFFGANYIKDVQPAQVYHYTLDELNKLKAYMEIEKPFLDSAISLQVLANNLELQPKSLSQIINKEFGKHFFDFVNDYRIKHACSLLVEEPEKTVIEIAYESGFNTKSTFNRVFKNHTNQTPLEYRKKVSL